MPENCAPNDDIPIGEVMVQAFRIEIENLTLRQLVLSMALNIPRDMLPADELELLKSVLEGA